MTDRQRRNANAQWQKQELKRLNAEWEQVCRQSRARIIAEAAQKERVLKQVKNEQLFKEV